MAKKIVIVDYGMGNLYSVSKRISKLKNDPVVTSKSEDIIKADKIILPGVGHFAKAMEHLNSLGILDALNESVLVKKTPILGICLGMQLMAKISEEGNKPVGLGWLDAEVVRFKVEDRVQFKVPHTGWNQMKISKDSLLLKGIPDNSSFYFVHSYYMKPQNTQDILGETEYESRFVSAVERNNIFGVQYHPEKSHDVGELLFKNFIDL